MPCSLVPTRRAGMMKMGRTINVSSVRRHSSANIAARVVRSTMTLLTTLPSVLVTAVWAPMTSLFSRDVIDPVGVLVKNATGILCTFANRARRRSNMSPSPTRELHQRCTMASAASAIAAATAIDANRTMRPRSLFGIAVSMMPRTTNGATSARRAAAKIATRNNAIVPR